MSKIYVKSTYPEKSCKTSAVGNDQQILVVTLANDQLHVSSDAIASALLACLLARFSVIYRAFTSLLIMTGIKLKRVPGSGTRVLNRLVWSL